MSNIIMPPRHLLLICNGSKCLKKCGKDIAKLAKRFVKKEIDKRDLRVVRTHCMGQCDFAPVVCLQPEQRWLQNTSEEEVLDILKEFK
ncbi:MAG: (2Fe-2S) ferredoxin domain-containing protein [Bacteroidia bacterium]